MRYKNELLVGIAIVAAVIIGIIGVRFLEGLPLLGAGYPLVAIFPDAQGITAGSPVRVSGVRVGRVDRVRLGTDAQQVIIDMIIDPAAQIPRGARISTSGFAALGDVQVSITPGPPQNPPLAARDTLYADVEADLVAYLQDRGPELFDRADTLLAAASGTFSTAEHLLTDTQGDLRQTLAALRGTTTAADQILRAERQRISDALASFQAASAGAAQLTTDLQGFTATHADTVALALSNLNQVLARTDAALHQVDATTAQVDLILHKLNAGEGTLGLLLNEPDLYYQLEETLTNLNRVIADFQEDPARYLRELRLIRLF